MNFKMLKIREGVSIVSLNKSKVGTYFVNEDGIKYFRGFGLISDEELEQSVRLKIAKLERENKRALTRERNRLKKYEHLK